MINPHLWIWCNQNCNNRINHLHERAQRIVYNCINHLHERAQRIVYNDDIPSFEDLLQTD